MTFSMGRALFFSDAPVYAYGRWGARPLGCGAAERADAAGLKSLWRAVLSGPSWGGPSWGGPSWGALSPLAAALPRTEAQGAPLCLAASAAASAGRSAREYLGSSNILPFSFNLLLWKHSGGAEGGGVTAFN